MIGDNNEREEFEQICRQPHRKMKRCFMTGKTCVYEDVIERHIQSIHDGAPIEGFMIIAYRPNLNVFYNWSLVRFFKLKYGTDAEILKRADQVRRTGYVICEKICRRIQESAFVVADISINNKNVFYELGLAYGLRQKLLVVHDTNSQTVDNLKKFLPDDMDEKIYAYPGIKPISDEVSFTNRFYFPPEISYIDKSNVKGGGIVVLELNPDVSNPMHSDTDTEREEDDISLTFMDVITGAVGVSIDNIVRYLGDPENLKPGEQLHPAYLDIINEMKGVTKVGCTPEFENIRTRIDNSFCTLIRTSGTHHFSYFWLGYCHATGKNVIPIYDVKDDKEKMDDLAFDIRSLWHLTLVRKEPTRILSELEEILKQMIIADFSEWSRKSFWARIFGHSGRVAIFTGALHNREFKREMIGDWDLRTASELMSYFSTHQLLSTIESPIYQPEMVNVGLANYIEQIRDLLTDKNAIVIASADVNPLTELLLGQLYGVPDNKLFSQELEPKQYPTAVTAIKKRNTYLFSWGDVPGKDDELIRFLRTDLDIGWVESAEISKSDDDKTIHILSDENSVEITIDEDKENVTLESSDGITRNLKAKRVNDNLNIYRMMGSMSDGSITPNGRVGTDKRFFFSEEDSSGDERGFRGTWLKNGELLEKYVSQAKITKETFKLYAHMVVALNPFVAGGERERDGDNYVVILNGISGPSTFALTQLLTGRRGGEFVDYDKKFDPSTESESILMQITNNLNRHVSRNFGFCGVQMIVEVTVGPPAKSETASQQNIDDQYLTFDSRRVKRWRIVPGTLGLMK